MNKALIGYTGFVGSNLTRQIEFDDFYNSRNINTIQGKSYELLVCAGARAEKWKINMEPEKDLDEINSLIKNLKQVKTNKLILISTIDVYANPNGVNEDTPINIDGLHAYGKNRFLLEEFCNANFETLIVRLPGLFGPGLKKNIIYDFLHNNNIHLIHHAGSFQYYNVERLWKDIKIPLDKDIKLINFATEPIRTDELAEKCFEIKEFTQQPVNLKPNSYNMLTKFDYLYGGKDGYMLNKNSVLKEIKKFVSREKKL